MPRAAKKRLEGAFNCDNNLHQAECERHNGPQSAPEETHIVQYAATLTSAQIEDAQTLSAAYDKSRGASCRRVLNAASKIDMPYMVRMLGSYYMSGRGWIHRHRMLISFKIRHTVVIPR